MADKITKSKPNKAVEASLMSDEERAVVVRSAVSHCLGLLEAARLIAQWKTASACWRRKRKINSKKFDLALQNQAFMWAGALGIEKPFLETLVRMNRRDTKEWKKLKKALPSDFKKILREITACSGAKLKEGSSARDTRI